MHRSGVRALFLALLLMILSQAIADPPPSGGDWVVRRSTIDGGGGRSSGGDFVLEGTIGQPDANASAAAPYRLSGGFHTRSAPSDRVFSDDFEF